ncbi:Permuted papain-like amidase enzyme, YaeF/YiiX, C92 family [Halomonas saccharevitans]|uniref:Permuted papain-like amidase enzyme, YaeF/YiiX, C92 family n=2 Tax=Halomonas saccharevitans TaxID=416872 RepID=A0A1I6XMC8_9GAMM|nr:Permuted papain-like amidase enzyme, YaeF/YiiX, C92 family [Halomonas saccharevitans]
MSSMLDRCGHGLGGWLSCPRPWHCPQQPVEEDIQACLEPGDVLLVEGSSRISTVIKYLTQSTWSHAALYVGEGSFVEADLSEGVRVVGFEAFDGHALRICRPVGLGPAEIDRLIAFVCARVGHRYDLRNLLDLARYLLPLPPVPTPWRRHMLGLGSGDPTRAICSTLIAEAFQSVRYPILPIPVAGRSRVFRRRHHSLFTPRDFDLSPWFEVVKPRLVGGFDPHALAWQEST